MAARIPPFIACFVAAGLALAASAQPVKLGAGSYFLAPKSGDRTVPKAALRTDALLPTAAQSAQWYSTVLYNPKPEALFVQPITVRPTAQGLEFVYPSKEVVPTERRDTVIQYPHRKPLLISPVAFEVGQSKLAKVGDWSVDISMARGADDMVATVAHGSPFAHIQISRGDVRLRLPSAGERFDNGSDPRTLALRVGGKAYALFGPTGGGWEQVSPTEWIGRLPAGKGYVATAALPDDKADTVAQFGRHAYAFIQGTRVDWAYDEARSQVQTTFSASTKTMEGPDNGPLLGLYPHQWFNNASVQPRLGAAYDTIRGQVKLLAASQFTTTATYQGFVPFWPGVAEGPRSADLRDVLKADQRNARRMMLEEGKGPYWQGKGLQRILKLMDVVEQQGDLEGRDRLLALVKGRAEQWLKGELIQRHTRLQRQ